MNGSLLHTAEGGPSRVLPTGTVTLLLADQQDSSRAWERDERAMAATTERLDALVDLEVLRHHGFRPIEQGEGDSFVAAFTRASDATACALAIQLETHRGDWPGGFQPRLRMALHTGEVDVLDAGRYMGPSLNRCGRLRSLAVGGQVLVSRTTADLLLDTLPPRTSLLDLGPHVLRGFDREEVIFQLCHPDLPSDFPLLPLDDAAPRVMPAGTPPLPLTRTIGRDRDIRAVATMLREGVRLLTLTGPGGVGKTRLSLEVARELAGDFRHGVHFLPLASIEDPSLLVRALADRSRIAVEGRPSALDSVIEYLRTRQLLLVLDNFEHLLAAAPQLAAILDACRMVQALVTSRHVLRVRGEQAFEVEPLATPPVSRTAPDPGAIAASPAVQLLVERAAQASAPLVVTDANASAIAELCRRLDGLPLAIELAAARIRLLPPAALLSRLDQRLDVLTEGAVNAAERHRTLRAAIDWSHDLMSEWERAVFARLSVFAGGCTLAVAEDVCRRPGEPDILDAVSSLVEQSLLVATSDGNSEPRLGMLESVRAYAWERLAERGEIDELQRRHLAWVVDLLDEAFPALCGPEQREWIERLDRERDNVRAAMRHALAVGEADTVARIALHSFVHLSLTDGLPELRNWIDRGAAVLRNAPEDVRTRYHLAAALCSVGLGDVDAARRHALDVGPLDRDSLEGDFALWLDAVVADDAGDRARADELLEQARLVSVRLGNQWAVGYVESTLGDRALRAGDADAAARHHARALGIARQVANAPLAGLSETRLALVAVLRHDAPAAVTQLEDAVAIFRTVGYRSGLLFCLDAGVIVAARLGQPSLAAQTLGALDAMRARSGARALPPMAPLLDAAESEVRRELGDAGYAEAHRRGAALDGDAAVRSLLVGLRAAAP